MKKALLVSAWSAAALMACQSPEAVTSPDVRTFGMKGESYVSIVALVRLCCGRTICNSDNVKIIYFNRCNRRLVNN